MTDVVLAVKNASRDTKGLLGRLNGDDSITLYHLEDITQRAALITALTAINGSVDGLEGTNAAMLTALGTVIAGLGSVDGHVDGLEASATAILAKLSADPATQTTLVALLAAVQAATPAGENHIGSVGGHTIVTTQAVGGSTTPYAAGDCVGALLTFAGFGRVAGGTGLVQMASVMSKSAQTVALDLVLFHTQPTTTFTDNAALALGATDWDKVLGVVHITDWTSLGTPSFGEATALALAYKVATGTEIYGVLVARGAFTLAANADLKVALKGLLD